MGNIFGFFRSWRNEYLARRNLASIYPDWGYPDPHLGPVKDYSKTIDLATVTLALSNSITNQVDALNTLDGQVIPLTRTEDRGEIAKRRMKILEAYNNYGLTVSNSIQRQAQEEALRNSVAYSGDKQSQGA